MPSERSPIRYAVAPDTIAQKPFQNALSASSWPASDASRRKDDRSPTPSAARVVMIADRSDARPSGSGPSSRSPRSAMASQWVARSISPLETYASAAAAPNQGRFASAVLGRLSIQRRIVDARPVLTYVVALVAISRAAYSTSFARA